MSKLPADDIYFGAAASSYDSERSGNPVTEQDDLAILNFLNKCKPDSVIGDVPAGTGRAAREILSRGFFYKGADISSEMLAICREKIQDSSSFDLAVADARNLPWKDRSIDHLISFKFIKWLPDDKIVGEVLKEFRRVCSGSALINVKIKRSKREISFRELIDVCRKLKDRRVLGTSARYIEKSKFEELCVGAGWKISSYTVNSASNGIVYNYFLE